MLLAIDIGNTNVVVGIYQNHQWEQIWRFETSPDRPGTSYELSLTNCFLEHDLSVGKVSAVVISSVVPPLTPAFEKLCHHMFTQEPLILDPEIYGNLQIDVNNPEEIGSDLVANAVAAFSKFGGECVVVDFGTALTFTTIGKDGRILGVSIAPGLRTAIRSLYDNTAKLPEVPLEVPKSVLGQDTIHAMQAGILIGYSGLVHEMIQRIRAEVGDHYQTVATGGLASILDPSHKQFDHVEKTLTLDGLRIVFEGQR